MAQACKLRGGLQTKSPAALALLCTPFAFRSRIKKPLSQGDAQARLPKAPLGFEPRNSCLLNRRFNLLSHGASMQAGSPEGRLRGSKHLETRPTSRYSQPKSVVLTTESGCPASLCVCWPSMLSECKCHNSGGTRTHNMCNIGSTKSQKSQRWWDSNPQPLNGLT